MEADHFDPWDPAHRPDPHPLYHRMRAEAPVYRGVGPVTGRGFWFLTRYADVQRAVRDPDIGRDHSRLPDNLAAPHRAAQQEPRIEEITTDLVDAMAAAGGQVDLLEALALPLPITVIAELLGIPINDRRQFRGWVDDLLRATDPELTRRSGTAFAAYLYEQVEHRRAHPGGDLLSQLIQAEEAGDRLSHDELLASVFLLLVAGHETTVNLIGNGTWELLRHPDQLARLRATPDLIGSAVEEIVRFNGPVESTRALFAMKDVDIDGVVVPQGEAIVPLLLAANRDPAEFPRPDEFDIARSPNRHLGFGHGIHFCLGAPLARLEGRIAIGALVQRFPDLDLAVDARQLEWTPGFFLRGLARLPVRVTASG